MIAVAPEVPEAVWFRQPGESDDAWQAFMFYRDADPGTRTLAKVSKKLGKSSTLIERWSAMNAWRKRVHAYDTEQDKLRIAAHDESVAEMARRHAQDANTILVKVVEHLKRLDPDALSPRDLIALYRACISVERQSRGCDMVLKRRLELPEF